MCKPRLVAYEADNTASHCVCTVHDHGQPMGNRFIQFCETSNQHNLLALRFQPSRACRLSSESLSHIQLRSMSMPYGYETHRTPGFFCSRILPSATTCILLAIRPRVRVDKQMARFSASLRSPNAAGNPLKPPARARKTWRVMNGSKLSSGASFCGAMPTCAPIPHRSLISLTGAHATQFLHGILTLGPPVPPKGAFFTAFLHAQVR